MQKENLKVMSPMKPLIPFEGSILLPQLLKKFEHIGSHTCRSGCGAQSASPERQMTMPIAFVIERTLRR